MMDHTTYGALSQPGVGFFMALIIGTIAGWLAEKLTKSDHGLLTNLFLGILGAVTGRFLLGLLNIIVFGFWSNLFSATLGAVVLIVAYRAIKGSPPPSTLP
jgi:uncharacterized membrane protein YeaQ/YmgE (transglycosylase-associated protein family)